jgi:hypothetical protein
MRRLRSTELSTIPEKPGSQALRGGRSTPARAHQGSPRRMKRADSDLYHWLADAILQGRHQLKGFPRSLQREAMGDQRA